MSPLATWSDDEGARTAEVEFIAGTLWQAVMARDVDALLRYADPVEVLDLRRQLRATDTALSCALFDTSCLPHHLRPAAGVVRTAVRDFFRKEPNAQLRVFYMGMPGALAMESRLDLAILTWLVPGSEADRKFPQHDLRRWGVDHVNACLIHNRNTGWRFHSDVGVFFCRGSLRLRN